jgi:hypothetical protein
VAVGPQTLILGNETLLHTHDAEKGLYTFEDDAGVYHFKEWTWGQKNAATNASVVFDEETGGFRIETARFNEAMLAASLIEATVDGQALEVSPSALRQLKASLGDKLLGLAQWVNGMLAEGEAGAAEPRFDPKTETYHLALGQDEFVFREWTWGEKNNVSSRSVVHDPATDSFRVDIATFNELMLEATLVEAPFEVTLENLQGLLASTGDALLDAAQRINGPLSREKKRS